MKYTRIEHERGYDIITTVDDAGNYEQVTKWHDGTIWHRNKTTLQEMGWHSVEEFLRERKRFNPT